MKNNVIFIERYIIIVLDARSAKDDTVLLQNYNDGIPPLEFDEWGLLS